VLNSCLKAAVRKRALSNNPAESAEAPVVGGETCGRVLDDDELKTLLTRFRPSALFPIVATAAFTGARRNEILALRWSDLDVAAKTLRIARALEQTKKFGLDFKEPKRALHARTITIDDELLAILTAEREKYLRLVAGVPQGAPVDLSMIRRYCFACTRSGRVRPTQAPPP
jgi:integrase